MREAGVAYLDDIRTARDQIAARLVEVTASPKPTYKIDGKWVRWTEYVAMLVKQLSVFNDILGDVGPDGPLEYWTVAV
jgi:hypothetical protein